jgi:5'-nucleotidase
MSRGLRLALGVAAIMVAAASALRSAQSAAPVDVQLLAINDFHGYLQPAAGSNGRIGGVVAGGVEYLSTHLARLRAQSPNTLIVSAGDDIGASPLLSGLFHDDPTIDALNAAGLQISSVGNHEFDEGWVELLRMQRGGCHPTDGCRDRMRFPGAHFEYLGANVHFDRSRAEPPLLKQVGWPATGGPTTLFPPFVVKAIGGVKIAFIGVTLHETQHMVMPSRILPITFDNEASVINTLVSVLERQGVHAIVALIHQGGTQNPDRDINGCVGFDGPIVHIVHALSPEVAVVLSGHTHRAYNCTIDGKLLTSASSYGRVITRIHLRIDPVTDRIMSKTAENVIVTRDVPKDRAESAIIARYTPFYTALAHRVIGHAPRTVTRQTDAAGESALGDLIADAQLEAARRVAGPDVAVAFMNTGGIRADLASTASDGSITYEDAFGIQPFGNEIFVRTMTGASLLRVLEQQFDGSDTFRVLQVSDGFTYRYDRTRPPGHRVDPATVKMNGQRLRPDTAYKVAMNEYLADGGDGFAAFGEGTNQIDCGSDIDALTSYLSSHSPLTPRRGDRIARDDRRD